jgi:hypothetical protein
MSGTEIVGDVAGARGLRFDPDFILAAEPYPNNELTCLAFNNSWRKIFVWRNEKALRDTSNNKQSGARH